MLSSWRKSISCVINYQLSPHTRCKKVAQRLKNEYLPWYIYLPLQSVHCTCTSGWLDISCNAICAKVKQSMLKPPPIIAPPLSYSWDIETWHLKAQKMIKPFYICTAHVQRGIISYLSKKMSGPHHQKNSRSMVDGGYLHLSRAMKLRNTIENSIKKNLVEKYNSEIQLRNQIKKCNWAMDWRVLASWEAVETNRLEIQLRITVEKYSWTIQLRNKIGKYSWEIQELRNGWQRGEWWFGY